MSEAGTRARPIPPAGRAFYTISCAASEFGQRWQVIPGTFDPYDLAAFGASVGLCWLIDRRYGPIT